ncbi:MAG: hypothetical protein Unbinned838contig1000_70 [Prokaryotic dsDNA virus sp.]|nr:MAG: hypothetical protein Unbinned838contig1000_70 [Prokaryotic dsDNA virus sp.]|tara:strand:- start:37712 stop:38305 length:594 start_codon:yes stop_codon:yes gene_type:complete
MKLSQELEKLRKVIKPTKTVDFIFPLTGYSKADLDPYLVNAYLGDVSMLDWDLESPDVFVLLKYSGHITFYELEKELERNEHFKTSYSLFRGKYIMFVFTIGPTFIDDFNKFMEGKYSKLSHPAKIRIMRHRKPNSPMPLILDKDKSLREYWELKLDAELPQKSEVWPIMNIDDELFDKSEFKELMGINEDLPLNLI